MAVPLRRSLPGVGLDKWQVLPSSYIPTNGGAGGGGFVPLGFNRPDYRHRQRDDLWSHPIDTIPSAVDPQLVLRAEGHQDIRWMSGRITSMLDPATSPDFGVTSGTPNPSPVGSTAFPIFGHDEVYRHDCKGRLDYWFCGQASEFNRSTHGTISGLDSTWGNGRTDVSTSNAGTMPLTGATAAASAPAGVSEVELRWPDQPGGAGCDSTGGNGGWLMAPDGRINSDHPLMPRQPGDRTEWATNSPQGGPGESGCGQNPNSRTGVGHRLRTPDAGGAPAEATTGGTWPFGHSYDAAGNLRCDGKHVFTYDGSNRLKDVYVPDMTTSPYDPTPGTRVAHFDYDGLGRQVRSVYNTDGDTSLDDEDVEWTPRDLLGRPIGIWRQGPVSEGSRPCAKPYQFFGYNSTGFRGTGYDASGGILDCPVVRWRDTDNDGTLDETLYYLQDLRGDITALLDPVSQDIVERVRYGPTGRPEAFPAADVNFDGKVDGGDKDAFEAALDAFTSDPANYDPRADLDRDGDVDAKDEELFFAGYGKFGGLSGNWKLSQGDGLTPGGTGADAGLDNRFGWRGYWYDSHLQKYHVRNRVYDPREGQWLQTDPIGFGAGDQNLYRYCGGEYSMGYDPLGLNPWGDIAMYVAGKVFPGIAIIESIRAGHIPGVPGIEMTTDGYRAAENNARHNGEQRPSVFDVLNSILVTALGGANAITGYSGYDPYNDRLVTGFERVLRTIVGTGEYFASAILPLLGELVAAEAAKGKGALPEPEPAPRPRLRSPQEEETCRREGEIDKYLKERGETPGSPNQRQGEQGAGRQGDRTGSNEYKSLNPGATAKTIINRVRNSVDEGGQARNITFDARGSGLSESEAREGIARSLGNYGPGGARGHRLDSIRVIGDGYDTGPVGQP